MMKEFNLKKFLTHTFICAALHTSLISCILIPFFKSVEMLPLQISILVTIKRMIRLIGDTFFGIIFDRFGAKIVFIIGRCLKLVSYIVLLINQNFIVLCVAMIIYGLSEGTIQGKVSSFIYNNLKANDRLSFFSRAISAYYLVINIHIALMSFIAGVVLKMYGYNIVIYISIAMNIFSLWLLVKLIPGREVINNNDFRAKSVKNIVVTLKSIVSSNHLFAYLIMTYGILVFFAWQFGSVASMILLDMGVDGTGVATLGSAVKICMAVGTLMSIFLIRNTLSLRQVVLMLTVLVGFGSASAVSYNLYIFCAFMLLIDLSYVTLEVSLEKNLEQMSDKTVRGTAISLAMTFSNIMAVVANLIVGFIAQYSNYKIALNTVMFVMLVMCLIVFVKTFKIFKKNKQVA